MRKPVEGWGTSDQHRSVGRFGRFLLFAYEDGSFSADLAGVKFEHEDGTLDDAKRRAEDALLTILQDAAKALGKAVVDDEAK